MKTNRYFFRSPELPKPSIAAQSADAPSLWKTDRLGVFVAASGWLGIAIYFLHKPISFSLIGLFFYLCCDGLGLLLVCAAIIVFELFLDTGDRSDYITLKLFSYKYEILRAGPLFADLQRRGVFFRGFKKQLIKYFPPLRFLLREAYRYDTIRLSSDFNRLSRSQKDPRQKFFHEFYRNSEVIRRWKYGDPKLQTFLEQLQGHRKGSPKRTLSLFTFFLISVVGEDGVFFAPPALLGINGWTATLFAFLFGFAHFRKYSTLNCLRIVFSALLIIGFILPKYGLLTCIVGHVTYDLAFIFTILLL